MKRILSLVLALIITVLFVGCSAENTYVNSSKPTVTQFEKPKSYASVILITINPQLRIYLDENDNVLAVEPVNKDAEKIAEKVSLKGKNFKDAVKNIVTVSNENGFIKENATVNVEIVEAKSEKVNKQQLLDTATAVVNTAAEEIKIEIAVKVEDKSDTVPSASSDNKDNPDTPSTSTPTPTPVPTYTSVKTKVGNWNFDYVDGNHLYQASLTLHGNEIITGASIGDDIEIMYPPEDIEAVKPDSTLFGGKYYWVARGTGPIPIKSVSEDGKTVTVTDANGKALVLERTSETTMKVTASPDVFAENLGKVPVGTVLTFEVPSAE